MSWGLLLQQCLIKNKNKKIYLLVFFFLSNSENIKPLDQSYSCISKDTRRSKDECCGDDVCEGPATLRLFVFKYVVHVG